MRFLICKLSSAFKGQALLLHPVEGGAFYFYAVVGEKEKLHSA